ncbi:hypothetical protein SISSUDRAFT_1042519 [Sistotremastrum suecicum HHB10207 ss-3]|uniref:CID domain-containing protein n=1 Tax=Sistotremastrum suecicum HHB10207 ss-3 TaxID=1314776 RepID=A0A166GIV3_9AGAM|nr:hypothetical protein SISSUDRAFT_1042519 [Sistotremastrum suecicum HHB10207 ss-3]
MASANSPGFQSMFEEVVHAKRLSNSKITKLCEIAMKNMENDSQMVSIMFRTHRSLSASGKVSSLYAIDALARNAKGAIEKKKVIADPNSPTGNCATFLLKLEGVLESIIQDMISTGTPEAKEKTKKILDIWTRHQTFSQSVMSRLAGITTEASGQGAYRDCHPVFAKYSFCSCNPIRASPCGCACKGVRHELRHVICSIQRRKALSQLHPLAIHEKRPRHPQM